MSGLRAALPRPKATLLAGAAALLFSVIAGCGSGSGDGGSGTQQLIYLLDRTNNRVAQFVMDGDGEIRPLATATVATGASPMAAAVDPQRQYVYVANRDDDTVSQFAISSTGSLSPLPVATVATGDAPVSLVVHPNGRYVYVANSGDNTISLFTISGRGPGELQVHIEAQFVTVSGAGLKEIGIDWTGSFLYGINEGSDNIAQFRITQTGNLTPLVPATVPLSGSPTDMAMNPRGPSFYVLVPDTGELEHAIIGANGGVTLQVTPQVNAATGGISLNVNPEGTTIALANSQQNRIHHYFMRNGLLESLSGKDTDTVAEPRRIVNSLRVSGETLVLGGLAVGTHEGARATVPELGSIPIVGRLFHQRTVDNTTTELLILISPTVIPDNGGS